MEIIARTLAGLEEVLADEIRELGGNEVQISNRAVTFNGDQKLIYKVNYNVRTAIDVLIPIRSFNSNNADDLYRKIQNIDWTKYMTVDSTFSITPIIHSIFFKHSQFTILKAKDAIVDQFSKKFDDRPDIDKRDPDLRIVLKVSDHKVTVLINSSGHQLFKRGYRKVTGIAPINEVLAAGILALTNWDASRPLIDPMCGSGTFEIEAGMKAMNLAPGSLGRPFGFQKWKDYNPELFEEVKNEAKSKEKTDVELNIKGFDKSMEMVRSARNNLSSFEALKGKITFEQADFFELNRQGEDGMILFNPPYNKRLEVREVETFYDRIGTRLKHEWMNYDAWIISSNLGALKRIGLKPKRKIKLFNGPDESRLVEIPLYRGSKKVKQD